MTLHSSAGQPAPAAAPTALESKGMAGGRPGHWVLGVGCLAAVEAEGLELHGLAGFFGRS